MSWLFERAIESRRGHDKLARVDEGASLALGFSGVAAVPSDRLASGRRWGRFTVSAIDRLGGEHWSSLVRERLASFQQLR
jgi:hypothetical protein